jgi:hypothetical protein
LKKRFLFIHTRDDNKNNSEVRGKENFLSKRKVENLKEEEIYENI